jgi:hypothetical protein
MVCKSDLQRLEPRKHAAHGQRARRAQQLSRGLVAAAAALRDALVHLARPNDESKK